MPYYTYILQSDKDGSYYIGSTQDLDARVKRHNQGRSKYTRSKRPWILVYSETYPKRAEALLWKRIIKNRKSRSYINKLVRTSRQSWREGSEFEPRRFRYYKIKGLRLIRNPLTVL